MSEANIRQSSSNTNVASAASVKQQLTRRVDANRKLIIDHRTYIDTIQLVNKKPIESWIVRRLRDTTDGSVIPFRSRAFQYSRGGGLRIHQPSDKTLATLIETVPNHLITRTDIPIDLLPRTQADTETLHHDLHMMITQPWRGHRIATTIEQTVYYGPRQTRRNVVIYSGRPSKVTSGRAVHLEFRYTNVASCQQRGITHAMDIVALDPLECVQRDFRLSALHWDLVDKRIQTEAYRFVRYYRNKERCPPAFTNVNTMRDRIQYIIRRQVTNDADEEPLPWADLRGAPVQAILDAHISSAMRLSIFPVSACSMAEPLYTNEPIEMPKREISDWPTTKTTT